MGAAARQGTVLFVFSRRVRLVELPELVMELSPSLVLAHHYADPRCTGDRAAFVRFGNSVHTNLDGGVTAALHAEARAALPRVGRSERMILELFMPFIRSGLPGPPGVARDALCLLALVRLDEWLGRAAARRGAPDPVAVELVAMAVGIASLGTIRTAR